MKIQKFIKSLVILGRRPVARGAIISIVVRVVALGLGFLQAIMTARLLGPEGFGTVAFALSIAAIAATFAMLGFGPLAVREVARLSVRADWPNLRGFLRFSGFVVFVASLVTAGFIAILALETELFDMRFRHEIAVASILVLPLAMTIYLRGALQGLGQVLLAQLPGDLLRPIILVGFLGVLLASGGSATTIDFLILVLCTTGLTAMLAALILSKSVQIQLNASVAKLESKKWSLSAAPFFAIFLFGVVGNEANTLLLGWLAGPAEAGLFQPVARLAPIMLIANEALAMPLAPRIAALWETRDLQGIRHLYRLATRVSAMVTVLVVVVVVLLAPFIFSAFGHEFLVNSHLMLWIGLAQIVNASTGPAGQLLAMAGAMRLRIMAQGLTVIVQLGLGLLLVGPYGADGAAMALVGAILMWSLAHWLFARLALGIDTSLLAGWRA